MPTYQVVCADCKDGGAIRLNFKEYEGVNKGDLTLTCNTCNGKCSIMFDPSGVSFILKDGESGGWASKSLKENKYRANRREVLARRERDNVFKTKLQPNFRGVETGTWRDAKEFARSEVTKDHGKDAGEAAALSYNNLVEKGT